MKEIQYVDEDGNEIAVVFDEVPHDGEVVILEHPLLGGRVDYVVTYHPTPPQRWYGDNMARGTRITLKPVGKVRVTLRERGRDSTANT